MNKNRSQPGLGAPDSTGPGLFRRAEGVKDRRRASRPDARSQEARLADSVGAWPGKPAKPQGSAKGRGLLAARPRASAGSTAGAQGAGLGGLQGALKAARRARGPRAPRAAGRPPPVWAPWAPGASGRPPPVRAPGPGGGAGPESHAQAPVWPACRHLPLRVHHGPSAQTQRACRGAHTRTRVCTRHLSHGVDPGTAHSPQHSRGSLSQPAPQTQSPPAAWALPRPHRPGGLAGRCTVYPWPPEPAQWTALPQSSAVAGHMAFEPAATPQVTGRLQRARPAFCHRGGRGLFSAARASPRRMFPRFLRPCADRGGESLLRTLDSSSTHLGDVPPGRAPSRPCCSTNPAQPRVSQRAPRAGGAQPGRALLPGGPRPAPPPAHLPLPTPLWGDATRLHPPLLTRRNPRQGHPGTPALQLRPSWKTPLQGAPSTSCWGARDPNTQEQSLPRRCPCSTPLPAPPPGTTADTQGGAWVTLYAWVQASLDDPIPRRPLLEATDSMTHTSSEVQASGHSWSPPLLS